MVDSISGGFTPPPPPPSSSQSSLTDEQSETLSGILEGFDLENLSDEDAQSIVSAISDAGIQPSSGLADALAENGLDAQSLAEQAGVTGQQPPPPPPPGEQSSGSGFNTIDITV